MQNQLSPSELEKKFDEQMDDHEGCIPYAYQDSKGYWTIARGRCIDKRINKRALSVDEMEYLWDNDKKACRLLLSTYPWYMNQDQVRKDVLVELCFNLGLDGLLGFRNMIKAVFVKDYKTAAAELLDSKWAREDVQPKRVSDVHDRLLNGVYR